MKYICICIFPNILSTSRTKQRGKYNDNVGITLHIICTVSTYILYGTEGREHRRRADELGAVVQQSPRVTRKRYQ